MPETEEKATDAKRSGAKSDNWYSKIVAAIGKKAVAKIIGAIVSMLLLAMVGTGIVTSVVTTSKTTQLGLKDIGELATQAAFYTNVELLEDSKKLWKVTLPFTSSRYIFSYDGTIKAGYDFADIEISPDKVTKPVTVRLPQVRILSNEIDTESLVVYDETQRIFSPLTVKNLNQSLSSMMKESETTAIENGLFEAAQENAKVIIRGFIMGMYPDYEVVFAE